MTTPVGNNGSITLPKECVEAISTFPKTCNMTTPGGIILSTNKSVLDGYTGLEIAKEAYMDDSNNAFLNGTLVYPAELVCIAILRASEPNSNFPIVITSDGIVEEIIECIVRLVAHEYTNVSSCANAITFLAQQRTLPLLLHSDDAQNTSSGELSVARFAGNTADKLPLLADNSLDYGDIVKFFEADSIAGSIPYGSPGSFWEVKGDPSFSADAGLRSPFWKGDIAAMMDAIAASVSAYVRSGPGSTPATG